MSNKASCIKCEYCDNVLENKEEYVKHLETYKHFICKYCEKDFFKADDLYFHFINQHTEEGLKKPHQCENCERRYGLLKNLNKHKKAKGH